MRWLSILIAGYLTGYMIFTFSARFDESELWFNFYFIWQSLVDGSVFAWGVIYYYIPNHLRNLVRWPLMLSGLLAVWEIISLVTGLNINNNLAVFLVFITAVGVSTYLVYIENKRINKYF